MTWSLKLGWIRTAARITLTAALVVPILGTVGFLALPPPPVPHCAQLVAEAISSPKSLVAGSFNCLAGSEQEAAAFGGYDGDAGLQRVAQARGRDHVSLIGATGDGGYLYEMSGKAVGPVLIIIWVDSTGHVSGIDSDRAH